MVHAGCWSHAERYFAEAERLNPQDAVATTIVARIDELFAIDAEARRQKLSLEARHALRQQQSQPLLDVIRQQIEAARSTALPGGASQGFELHAHPVGSVDSLSGIPGTGVEQQLGGELDGTGGTWSKELDPYRERAGRTEDRGYSLGRGKPSPVEVPALDYLAAILPGIANGLIQGLPKLTPSR